MASQQIQDGNIITWAATAAKTNKQIVLIGATFGVCLEAADSGEAIGVALEGVWQLPKYAEANSAIAQGAKVYARLSTGTYSITGLATGGTLIGTGFVAAVTGATEGVVKLLGHPA